MDNKKYNIINVKDEIKLFNKDEFWKEIPSLTINNYLWMNNGYNPKVEVKSCHSYSSLFLRFRVYEKEITATYTEINSPVHKDSCVEFFINLFPDKTDEYFNFEINAIGTIYVGFGAVGNRGAIVKDDVKEIQITSTYTKPFKGIHGGEYWEVSYKIPITLFEKYFGFKFTTTRAKGNFYKCGDNTKYEHYGAWNKVVSEKPNFHLPNYFGELNIL